MESLISFCLSAYDKDIRIEVGEDSVLGVDAGEKSNHLHSKGCDWVCYDEYECDCRQYQHRQRQSLLVTITPSEPNITRCSSTGSPPPTSHPKPISSRHYRRLRPPWPSAPHPSQAAEQRPRRPCTCAATGRSAQNLDLGTQWPRRRASWDPRQTIIVSQV